MKQITVRSIPADNGWQYLDCSECGPLGLVAYGQVHTVVADHMEEHGVNADELRNP